MEDEFEEEIFTSEENFEEENFEDNEETYTPEEEGFLKGYEEALDTEEQ